jgi:hypothetical protein
MTQERKQTGIRLNTKVKIELKKEAIDRDISMEDHINNVLYEYLEKQGKTKDFEATKNIDDSNLE